MSATTLVTAPLSGVLSTKVPAKYVIQAGLLINVVGVLVMRSVIAPDAKAPMLIPDLVLFGIGMGMVMAQISNMTLSAVPVYQAGEASGLNNTLRQVSATLGAAMIGAVLLSAVSANMTNGIASSTVIPDQQKPSVIDAVEKQVSNIEFTGTTQIAARLPKPIAQVLGVLAKQSTATSAKTAALYAAAFIFLDCLTSFALPKRTKEHH